MSDYRTCATCGEPMKVGWLIRWLCDHGYEMQHGEVECRDRLIGQRDRLHHALERLVHEFCPESKEAWAEARAALAASKAGASREPPEGK